MDEVSARLPEIFHENPRSISAKLNQLPSITPKRPLRLKPCRRSQPPMIGIKAIHKRDVPSLHSPASIINTIEQLWQVSRVECAHYARAVSICAEIAPCFHRLRRKPEEAPAHHREGHVAQDSSKALELRIGLVGGARAERGAGCAVVIGIGGYQGFDLRESSVLEGQRREEGE